MTHIEISDLIVEYIKRYPEVTIGELCGDNVDGMYYNLKIKNLKVSSNSYITHFHRNGMIVINIYYGKIFYFCKDSTLQESKIAMLKLLTDGKEDLI